MDEPKTLLANFKNTIINTVNLIKKKGINKTYLGIYFCLESDQLYLNYSDSMPLLPEIKTRHCLFTLYYTIYLLSEEKTVTQQIDEFITAP